MCYGTGTATPKGPTLTQPVLSVQLYSVAGPLKNNLDNTLARLAGMGLREVEVFDFVTRAPELAEALRRHELSARTGHGPFLSDQLTVGDEVRPAPDPADVFAAAQALGLEIVFDPFVAPERWVDEREVAATAARLNRAAEQAAGYGLKVGYHNHAQEFVESFGGTSAYELFVSQLDEDIALEVDLYWAATGRQDVAALLGRLGNRVKALHLKDGIIGPNPFRVGAAKPDPVSFQQRPAGQGELPLLEFLAAAPSTEFGVIEFDHYVGDIFAGIQASVDFFRANGLG